MKKYIIIIIILIAYLGCKSTNTVEKFSAKVDKTEAFGIKPELIRQPYLQMVREDSAIITWKTNEISSNCFVEFVEKGVNNTSGEKGYLTPHEGYMFNEVSISNLKPKTTYSYSIYSNGHLLASGEGYHFTTAPDNNKTAFSFYALGDIGAKTQSGFAKEPATRITELKQKPDFGLGLGDIVYPKGESKNYDNHLFKPFQEVFKNIPFYPVAGNHDWLSDPEKNFDKEWALPGNEHYYSFTYSNALFIGLDSSDGNFYNVIEQTAWLKQTLKDNKGQYDWTVIYLHHNGKTCTYKNDYEHVKNLYKIFSENNVDLVLNGHAHTYERLKPYDGDGNVDLSRTNEINYDDLENRFISITMGAGGKLNKKWKADPNDKENCDDGTIVAHFEHVPSFGLFSIDGKTLSFKGINSNTGKTFDSFTILK
ncbi:metallophosphoesterase family protein [Algibacter sp.]|nr:metallophosphoesterase family protein [Algibacter sp.]MDA9070026.1 metallophosphoesterase family protein [Algibacter sp.]MDB4225733.1 metallophosphoesterase family protein [bacterium]MDC1226142.1 metallophosphoesterase family protein [Algibacter sp.]MDC1276747.1 metallophosphoesterase family protein [Algibacter sp.]